MLQKDVTSYKMSIINTWYNLGVKFQSEDLFGATCRPVNTKVSYVDDTVKASIAIRRQHSLRNLQQAGYGSARSPLPLFSGFSRP